MFKKMQLKLTFFYTLILVMILLVSYLSVYFLLSFYNNYQLSSEIDNMLINIESSEWVEETLDETTDDGVENLKNMSGVDALIVHYSDDIKDKDDDDDDSVDKDNSSSKTTDDHSNTTNSDVDNTNTDTTEELEDGKQENQLEESKLPTSKDLVVPKSIKGFPFYFLFSENNTLIKWQNNTNFTNDDFLSHLKSLLVDEQPEVIRVGPSEENYFLVAKRSIKISDYRLGDYIVGKEVTVAYETMANLKRILFFSFIVGVMTSVLLGYFIAGRTMKPIKESYMAKQQFIADASHELRTPLSVVLLSCDVLNDTTISPEFRKNTILDIKEETLRMKTLVEKLLFLARHDSDKIHLRTEWTNISNLIALNLKSYTHLAKEKNVVLESHYQDKIMAVVDGDMINSLISILVDNAIKYTTKNGYVTINLEKKIEKNGGFLELRVFNTGDSIQEENLEKVFDRFYRVDASRSKAVVGHGLGLSIAKDIVVKHGGKIRVENGLEGGVTFVANLPLQ